MKGAADCLQIQYVVDFDHCIQMGVASQDHVMVEITVIHCRMMELGVAHWRTMMEDIVHHELVDVADQHLWLLHHQKVL